MAGGFPDLSSYPETIIARDGRILRRRPSARAACVKCKGATIVAYGTPARLWPTCLPCARQAAAQPCPNCGDRTPAKASHWTVPPADEGGHAAAYFMTEHESGARCRAFERSGTFTITCSSCSAPIRWRLIVSANRIGSGVSKELRCGACGARWRLGDERRGSVVYVGPPAA
jgi:hypothetical protein